MDLPEEFGGLLRPEQVELSFDKRYNRKARGNRAAGGFFKQSYPKWMVYDEKETIEIDDLGLPFVENPQAEMNHSTTNGPLGVVQDWFSKP